MSDADKPASLPQLKEMAKGIAMAVADEADFNEWSRLWYIDDDDEVDSYSREKVVRQIAIRAKPVLAPLYAELERKDAAIERMRKLLVEWRQFVADTAHAEFLLAMFSRNVDDMRLHGAIASAWESLLTRIDKGTGGK